MKRLRDLSINDLKTVPVWLYRSDTDDDQADVEPTTLRELTERAHQTYIALADFALADGRVFGGFCSPTDDSGLDYLQPVLIVGGDHVPLWAGGTAVEIAKQLGATPESVFPIQLRCAIPVDGNYLSRVITQSDVGRHN